MKRTIRKLNIVFLVFVVLLLFLLFLVIYRHEPAKRYVLLSFDVEPVDGRENVEEILDILSDSHINATFFVTGEYAQQYPSVVRRMANYEVGCHGYSHKAFTKMDYEEKEREMTRCSDAVINATGMRVAGFRAPYNLIDAETLDILDGLGFTYDASIIKGLGFLYPGFATTDIGEIPVSSIFGVPLEDVVWAYYLRLDGAYFYILQNKVGEIESYLFHPHHIVGHKKEFITFINHLKTLNVTFISHLELTQAHEGV
jgi:peptidoglycan/xylan/chitin deacetylase (PgdA/CDA1 family)